MKADDGAEREQCCWSRTLDRLGGTGCGWQLGQAILGCGWKVEKVDRLWWKGAGKGRILGVCRERGK